MNSARSTFGVGVIGAGLAFQAIHARVLAGLPQDFSLRAVWDPNPTRADDAARWLGATAALQCDDMLEDPEIDIVVIASPARFHAEQALAAMRAGKKAVLVEKPLCATPEEADAIASEALATGSALLVGAMHTYDPAWLAARNVIAAAKFAPALVRSSIVLPPNARFEKWATEPLTPALAPSTGAPGMTPEQMMRLCILELAIHDLPLVRTLLPAGESPRVLSARLRTPTGFAVTVAVGDVLVDLSAVFHGHWQTDWVLEASGAQGRLKLDFTPSFVAAGSGVMAWQGLDGSILQSRASENGYTGQWVAISEMLRGERAIPDPCQIAADFRFAHSIAEQAVQTITGDTSNDR